MRTRKKRLKHACKIPDKTRIQKSSQLKHPLSLRTILNELHREKKRSFAYAKTKAQISFAVTAKLISAFVFATRIVQFLFYLNPKFQASSFFLRLHRPVYVGPGRKPEDRFSCVTAQMVSNTLGIAITRREL